MLHDKGVMFAEKFTVYIGGHLNLVFGAEKPEGFSHGEWNVGGDCLSREG